MVLNRTIQIRLTKEQYDRVKAASLSKGFETLSSFLRHAALGQDDLLHQRIGEIHRSLIGSQPAPKKGYKANPAMGREVTPGRQ